MPTLQENLQTWTKHDWSLNGDEWSVPWGSTENMWWGTILPRIRSFVPTNTILEIAPGCGRVTQFLKNFGDKLLLVDLAENCIEICKERFASHNHIEYFVNDGKSLDMLSDESIDFAFSFASLVHAEIDVIEAYLKQLAKKLKPNGVGFFHHSNVKECFSLSSALPPRERILSAAVLRGHWRGLSVSALNFEQICDQTGLECIGQELINWTVDLPLPIDCFSIFTRKGSIFTRQNVVYLNLNFVKEIRYVANVSEVYTGFDNKHYA